MHEAALSGYVAVHAVAFESCVAKEKGASLTSQTLQQVTCPPRILQTPLSDGEGACAT